MVEGSGVFGDWEMDLKREPLVAKDSRPRRARPRWRSIVAVGLIVAAVAARSPDIWTWQQSLVADRLAAVAGANEGSSGRLAFNRLMQLGDAAIEPLVRVAASRHAAIAADAQQILLDRLAAWESAFASGGDDELFAGRIVMLATALDQHMREFSHNGWGWAQRLSHTLVHHCDHLPAAEAMRTLVACERMASIGQPLANRQFSLNDLGAELPSDVSHDEVEQAPHARDAIEAVVDKPKPTVESPAPPIAAVPLEAVVEPREVTDAADARPLADLWMLPTDAPGAPPAQEESSNKTPVASQGGKPIDIPSPDEVRRNIRRWREHSDRELLAQLATAPRFDAAAIRQVLRTRGYGEQVLKLISQLSQAKPAERRQALERVSALPAAEARGLLHWFVGDEDAEIRLQALSMLATSSDPRLPEILRERAVEDADPRVSDLASRILRGEVK